MGARIDREELRKFIREALKEALDGESLVPPPSRTGEERPTRHPSPSPQRGAERASFPAGVLTEAKLVALAKAHSKVVIGNDVAITPLARDRARELKIEIVRQKP